jgi:hypothetical protein
MYFYILQYAQRSKETWQLQLLLTYLQNGISEQWQKIPSIIAVFAAEASLTLLDGSHAQFTVIRNFLMHSTSVSLQVTILSFFICIYVASHSVYSEVLNFSNIIILFVAEHSVISNLIAEQFCAF